MLLTCMKPRTLAPSPRSEIVIVIIMAMVIVTLRHSPVTTSVRRISRASGGVPSQCVTRSAGFDVVVRRLAVNAARLVADDVPAFDLDHPTPHLVHDVGVVGHHDDGGTGAVDPV